MNSNNTMMLVCLLLFSCERATNEQHAPRIVSNWVDLSSGPEAFSTNASKSFALDVRVAASLGEAQIEKLFKTTQPARLMGPDGKEIQTTIALTRSSLPTTPGFTMKLTATEKLTDGWYELVMDDFFSRYQLTTTSRFHKRKDGRLSAFYHVGSLPIITDLSVQGERTLSIRFSEPIHLTDSSALRLSTDKATLACTLDERQMADGIEKVFQCDSIPDAFSLDIRAMGASAVDVSRFAGKLPLVVELAPVPDSADTRNWALWNHVE